MLDDDGVVLTQHEHEVLAALASSMDDGWLAHQLAGGDPQSSALAVPRWLGPALLVLGVFMLIPAFMSRWWVGAVGMVLMVFGTWLAYGNADTVAPDLGPPAGTEHLRGRP